MWKFIKLYTNRQEILLNSEQKKLLWNLIKRDGKAIFQYLIKRRTLILASPSYAKKLIQAKIIKSSNLF